MALRLLITLGPGESESVRWLALLLTYFAHALTWTLAATLLLRMTELSASRANTVWKLTLLGPLATTILSAGLPWMPLWSWHETLPEVMAKVTPSTSTAWSGRLSARHQEERRRAIQDPARESSRVEQSGG